ncbi:MAG: TonB-dependent receptor, partial [Bacteroidia bacterium]
NIFIPISDLISIFIITIGSFLYLFFFIYGQSLFAQNLKGKVVDKSSNEPIITASIFWQGSSTAATTNVKGEFEIEDLKQFDSLVVSFVGFKTKTILRKNINGYLNIKLESNTGLGTVVIEEKVNSKQKLSIETGLVEKISSRELKKAACCNLSESFETNPSVDVNFADAISGAKRVQLLGLDGIYSLITLENIPEIRGLSASYGLSSIPGPWIESIQLAKGVGSVINGFEAITGQINVELKKPMAAPKFHINSYVNSLGRYETSINGQFKVSDNLSTMLLIHGNTMQNAVDANADNFIDVPMINQFTGTNRWQYYNDKIESQFGVEFFTEERQAGEVGFNKSDSISQFKPWGLWVKQQRFKAYAKVGILPTDARPNRSLGIINRYSTYRQQSQYGLKEYDGVNNYWYTNVIFQDQLFSRFNTIKLGGGFFIDDYQQSFTDGLNSRTEPVGLNRTEQSAGLFAEYTYDPNIRFTLIAGSRVDYHNMFGAFATPRLHLRYKLRKNLTWRLAAGSGQRTPNALVDNSRVMVSSRQIVFQKDLLQEKAWNFGTSFVWDFEIKKREASVTLDVFHTEFENMLMMDMDANLQQLTFYNQFGRCYSSVAQVEANYELLKRLDLRVSYKVQDVKSTFVESGLRAVPFVAKNKFLANMGYSTKGRRWSFDITTLRITPGRLAESIDVSGFDEPRPFWRVNGQVTFKFKTFEAYLGGENLTGFTQDNPIISAQSPFSETFDAANVWAPVYGRII